VAGRVPAGERHVANGRGVGRIVAAAAVVLAFAAVAVVLIAPGGPDYEVHARFQNASQLVKGNLVQVAGSAIGTITNIDLTRDGQADVTLKITDHDYVPLRRGTKAVVRQASLSGVANRYVDLQLPDGTKTQKIEPGGVIDQADTTTAVDLDQLFNTFDPKTRKALSGLIRGYSTSYGGRGAAANAGFHYLNPGIAASSRLFRELNYDTPMFRRFVVASSKLVTDVASRRDDLAGLVDHLATTTGAIGAKKQALADALAQLPPFMRSANSTFVNLRATLDDLTPLVNESKPVAPKLRRFLAQLRPLTADARPTVHDLAAIIRKSGADNDLVELTRSTVPLRDIAVGPVTRNGKQREGALPASAKALGAAVPEISYARPYAPDLTGWFDDFSHSGIYDALGGASRASLHVSAFTAANGVLTPIPPELREPAFQQLASLGQRDRCPGAIERGALWKPSPDYACDDKQVPEGS
jgi:phospholipid/cholesterol/gamma-HCH transport system substrate-binding protein